MNKTELLDRLARDGEERLLLSRVLDKLELTRRRSIPAHTSFLSQSERAAAESLIQSCGQPDHLFFGGYEGAERTVCAFLPDWMEGEDWQGAEDCPVRALRCSYPQGPDPPGLSRVHSGPGDYPGKGGRSAGGGYRLRYSGAG